MSKWTVLLIPQDGRRNTRSLSLRAYQFWMAVALIVGLSFTSAFFFSRQQAIAGEVHRLQQDNAALERQYAAKPERETPAFTAQDRLEFEQRVRSEYEASLAAITAKLTDLYDMEAQALKLTGLAPKRTSGDNGDAVGGGKGGGSSDLGEMSYEEQDIMATPAHVIYGLSRPSADLVIQEINLRTESLGQLVTDLETRREQVARIPSAWPLQGTPGRITSSFGYRKDPFTYRVRHHDGTDIAARTGTPIVATARGVVAFAGYERGLGRVVRVDHGNGIMTCYGHLRKTLVKVGDDVERLELIGTLGSTGRSTGPHVHYEVRINGKPVNPAKYLGD